jgi:hypothetical protein
VWERITALSGDPLLARKRLTSRSTRYSGLLDLLSFQEGDAEGQSASQPASQPASGRSLTQPRALPCRACHGVHVGGWRPRD